MIVNLHQGQMVLDSQYFSVLLQTSLLIQFFWEPETKHHTKNIKSVSNKNNIYSEDDYGNKVSSIDDFNFEKKTNVLDFSSLNFFCSKKQKQLIL